MSNILTHSLGYLLENDILDFFYCINFVLKKISHSLLNTVIKCILSSSQDGVTTYRNIYSVKMNIKIGENT